MDKMTKICCPTQKEDIINALFFSESSVVLDPVSGEALEKNPDLKSFAYPSVRKTYTRQSRRNLNWFGYEI